mgnify:CR=1 FL=1
MKTNETAKKGMMVGVGAGLVLFVLAGLLPGSTMGGLVGLKIVNAISGGPMAVAVLPKIILALSMLLGVLFAAVVYVVGSGMIGWSVGHLIDSARVKAGVGNTAPTGSGN